MKKLFFAVSLVVGLTMIVSCDDDYQEITSPEMSLDQTAPEGNAGSGGEGSGCPGGC